MLAVGLTGCDSTESDANAVAQQLADLPSVVGVSGSGQGMSLNTDANSEVLVEVLPAASIDQLQAIATAWYDASAELPKTSLRIAMPSATDVDSELVFARDALAATDLPPRVEAWFALAGTYERASSVYADTAGMSYVVTAAATPAGLAGIVEHLRESGVDASMSWWFYSTEIGDSSRFTDGQSFTSFSRNHLPTSDLLSLAAGFESAYTVAADLGGMDLDVSENNDGVTYTATVNLNSSGASDLATLPDSESWAVVHEVGAAVDPSLGIYVTYYALGGEAFAELDTADCDTKDYVSYELVGPALWQDWADTWGVDDCA